MPRITARASGSQVTDEVVTRKHASTACLACRSARVKCNRPLDGAQCLRCRELSQPCKILPSQRGRRFTKQTNDLWQELDQVCRMAVQMSDLFIPTRSFSDASMAVASTEVLEGLRNALQSAQETLDLVKNDRLMVNQSTSSALASSDSHSTLSRLPGSRSDAVGTEIAVMLRDRKSVLHKSFFSQKSPESADVDNDTLSHHHPLDTFAQITRNLSEEMDGVAPVEANVVHGAHNTTWAPALISTLLNEKDIDELFTIHFQKMSRHCRLFSPSQANPRNVAKVSTFLLVSNWQGRLCELVMEQWMSITKGGLASVEIVQALLLISAWSPPLGSEDRSWQLLGHAIPLAIQLDLHIPPPQSVILSAEDDDELLKRVRTWLVLYIHDRSLSAQTGRPILAPDTSLTLHIDLWYSFRPMEVGDGLYVELQHIFRNALLSGDGSSFIRSPSFDSNLDTWWSKAQTLLARQDLDDAERAYQSAMNQFFYSYYSLIIHTLDLQTMSRKGSIDTSRIRTGCFSHASNAVMCLVDRLDGQGFLGECPESYFVFGAYCAVSLVSLSLDSERSDAIRQVQRVIKCYSRIGTDSWHAPLVYARFLTDSLKASRKATSSSTVNNKAVAEGHTRSGNGRDHSIGPTTLLASDPSPQLGHASTSIINDILDPELIQDGPGDVFNLLPGYGNELFDFLAHQMW